jgi:gamma-glutamylputrescine oxidase
MLSYWEKQSFLKYDYLIIGGGIVGLSAAASLAEKEPIARIAVLERGLFPSGASTKNAGFACFGSLTELLADLRHLSEAETLSIVQNRWEGLTELRKRLGDKAIDLKNYGGYELIFEKDAPALDELSRVNRLLKPIFKQNVFELKNENIERFGFGKKGLKALVFNAFEGQIDTGMMMSSLINYVQKLGITIFTACEVSSFDDNGEKVEVQVKNTSSEAIVFSADKVGICTNAFTNSLLPHLPIRSGRGQVIATAPIEKLPFVGTFHFDEGYYYFRNHGKRVIFGGGRNLDFEGETTTEFAYTDLIMKDLEKKLKEIILPDLAFEITDRWAGIMAFGDSKKPILERHSENVVLGVRMGGMGVAIGSQVGRKMAEMMT